MARRRNIGRRDFLRTSGAVLGGLALSAWPLKPGAADGTERPPNFVFFLADDLGYMDLASYAARVREVDRSDCYYETPNIDRLADAGVSFSQAYVCPLCSPTRASILTGQYASRNGFNRALRVHPTTYASRGLTPPPGSHPYDVILPSSEASPELAFLEPSAASALPSGQVADKGRNVRTIAEALVGYESAFIGKWHVGGGGVDGYQPSDQGFREIAYADRGWSNYHDWRPEWDRPGEETGQDYLTDDLTTQGLRFLDERSQEPGKPFMLYLCHFAVHGPWDQSKDEYVRHFEQKPNRGWNGHADPNYAAMIKSLDDSLGAVLDQLEKTGLARNTVVVFLSDNGGALKVTSNAPLRGGKVWLHEGGIRVPLIISWPGHSRPGSVCDLPVDSNDIYPTLADLAGVDYADYRAPGVGDGQSLKPLLRDPANGEGRYSRDTFIWHDPFWRGRVGTGLERTPKSAIRVGDYKLFWYALGYVELYDVTRDIGETHNLADEMPEKAKELYRKLKHWLDTQVEGCYKVRPNPTYDPQAASRFSPQRDLENAMGWDRPVPFEPTAR